MRAIQHICHDLSVEEAPLGAAGELSKLNDVATDAEEADGASVVEEADEAVVEEADGASVGHSDTEGRTYTWRGLAVVAWGAALSWMVAVGAAAVGKALGTGLVGGGGRSCAPM